GGAVRGSLVLDGSATTVTFVATAGALPSGSYQVRLHSGQPGFSDTAGNLLDGATTGQPGSDFTTGFEIDTPRVVGVPSFARGPGQTILWPITADSVENALPLEISDASDVTSISFAVSYNPELLSVTGIAPTSSLPAGWLVQAE